MLLDGKWYLNIMETKVWLVETRLANTVFVAVPPSLYILCQLVCLNLMFLCLLL